MTDHVINQLHLSRAIPGVSFNFIAFVEPEIPTLSKKKFLAYNKNPKFSKGLRHTKNRTPSPVTHSPTHSLSLTLDLGNSPKLFYSFTTILFTPFF